MKSINISAISILLASVSIFMYSCKSDELTRSEAENLIKLKYSLPKDETKEFNFRENAGKTVYYDFFDDKHDHYELNTVKPVNGAFAMLENEGLIKINKVKESTAGGPYKDPYGRYILYRDLHYYDAIFTDKAKPYCIGSTVKVATIEFGGITGIIERKELNIAEVDYTEIRKNITPFGKAYNLNEEILNRKITFTKYDDGWRINK